MERREYMIDKHRVLTHTVNRIRNKLRKIIISSLLPH
jgi:hypothetical protein